MYTKGEWKVEDRFIRSANGDNIAQWLGYTTTNFEANANLIVSAVNGCASVNSDNPQAVAENIKDMYEALKGLMRDYSTNPNSDIFYAACLKARGALVKAEGK